MFRDTSMDYLSRDEVLEIWNHNMRLTDEQLLAMDETEFRARVKNVPIIPWRSVICHRISPPEIKAQPGRLYEASAGTVGEKRIGKRSAGISVCLFPDRCSGETGKGEDVDLTPYKPTPVTEQMEKDFFTIVKERRSVREFKDKEVPDELIDKILEAGLWAAHGCNVQSIRYVVVREKNEPGLFHGSDVPGGQCIW